MKRLLLSILILMPLHASNSAVHEFSAGSNQQEALSQICEKNRIVVIKFYSKTCPPCKAIAPHFEALAKEYSNFAHFLSIDAHVHGAISNQFGIRAVPSFVVLAQGKQPAIFKGSQHLAAVRSTLESYTKQK
jgi:thioredoxin-like negative regulator of GroEL